MKIERLEIWIVELIIAIIILINCKWWLYDGDCQLNVDCLIIGALSFFELLWSFYLLTPFIFFKFLLIKLIIKKENSVFILYVSFFVRNNNFFIIIIIIIIIIINN